jgi:Uma2 family endonuclease
MPTQTANYIEAIHHLPAGSLLSIDNVSWEEYEQLLADLGDNYGVRINYDHGRLMIMSPSRYHEMYDRLLESLALITAERMGCDFESCGSTTFKEESFKSGAEPDTCFYVQNAARIIGKRRLDLHLDPPPDIIVEIDISHASRYKFDFYAHMGVPEIWLYDEKLLQIYHLIDKSYVIANASLAFPVLTGELLTRFLEQSKTEGQSAARRAFRHWLKLTSI